VVWVREGGWVVGDEGGIEGVREGGRVVWVRVGGCERGRSGGVGESGRV